MDELLPSFRRNALPSFSRSIAHEEICMDLSTPVATLYQNKMRWVLHVTRIGKNINAYMVCSRKRKRTLREVKERDDNIKVELTGIYWKRRGVYSCSCVQRLLSGAREHRNDFSCYVKGGQLRKKTGQVLDA